MMNNRRNFLKGMLLAAVAPGLLLSVAKDRTRWKRTSQQLWVPNPEYANARYEIAYVYADPTLKAWSELMNKAQWEPGMGNVMRRIEVRRRVEGPYPPPIRFNDEGKVVPTHILAALDATS